MITDNERIQTNRFINDYKLKDINNLFDKVLCIYRADVKYSLQCIGRVLNKSFLETQIPYNLKKANQKFIILLLCWNNDVLLTEIAKHSVNSGATIRDLTKLGYKWYKPNGGNAVFIKNNKQYRRCIGYDDSVCAFPNNTLTKKYRMILTKGKRCPFSASTSNLEIDHRTPILASQKRNEAPFMLNSDIINSLDVFDKYFQILTGSINSRKREVCMKCLNGLPIIIPEIVHNKYRYKQNLEDGNKNTCDGCVWHNWKKPLRM